MSQDTSYHNKHLPWLDLIRFLSAFTILAAHYRAASFVEYGLLPAENQNYFTQLFYLLTRGGGGVLIFFVLSGFFIMGRGIEKCKAHSFSLRKYAVDRFARIMLPLSSALLLLVIVNYVCGFQFSWINIILNLFSLQGVLCEPAVGPLWSLSYEVWFYILFGATAQIITNSTNEIKTANPSLGVIYCVAVVCVSFIVFTKLSSYYLFMWIMGGLTYIIPMRKSTWILTFSLIGLVSSQLLMELVKNSRSIPFAIDIPMPVVELIFALFCCMFIKQVCQFTPKGKSAVVVNRIGTYLANFSYTLYLTHMVVLKLMINYGMPKSNVINAESIILYALEIVTALVVAYLIYLMFERHTRQLKNFILAHTQRK